MTTTKATTTPPSGAPANGGVLAGGTALLDAAGVKDVEGINADGEFVGDYVDPIGLTLMTSNILTRPPSGIIYGPSGSGKTTQVAMAFNNCLWLVTGDTILRPYASWCRDNWQQTIDLGMRTPVKPIPNVHYDPNAGEYVDSDPKTHARKGRDGKKNRKTKWVVRLWHEGGMAIKELPELMPDGVNPVDNWTFLGRILFQWCASCAGKTTGMDAQGNMVFVDPAAPVVNPYEGIVIDEVNRLFARIYDWMQMLLKQNHPLFLTDRGKQDIWAVPRVFAQFVRRVFQVPRSTGRVLLAVSHESAPKYEGDKPTPGHKYGELKYMGGPEMPTGTTIGSICAAVDFVMRTTIERAGGGDPEAKAKPADGAGGAGGATASRVKRKYWTEIDPLWYCKFRDFRAAPEEEFGLRELLLRAGYDI